MMTDDRVTRIFDTVQQVTGIDRATIESATRRRDVFFARMIVAHHLRSLGLTYSQIGGVLGGRTHSTVVWQCDCYSCERTPVFRRNAEKVREILSKN